VKQFFWKSALAMMLIGWGGFILIAFANDYRVAFAFLFGSGFVGLLGYWVVYGPEGFGAKPRSDFFP
jgi:hypothetical protein